MGLCQKTSSKKNIAKLIEDNPNSYIVTGKEINPYEFVKNLESASKKV